MWPTAPLLLSLSSLSYHFPSLTTILLSQGYFWALKSQLFISVKKEKEKEMGAESCGPEHLSPSTRLLIGESFFKPSFFFFFFFFRNCKKHENSFNKIINARSFPLFYGPLLGTYLAWCLFPFLCIQQ